MPATTPMPDGALVLGRVRHAADTRFRFEGLAADDLFDRPATRPPGRAVTAVVDEHASRLPACVAGIGEEGFIPVVYLRPDGGFPNLVGRQLPCECLAV